jgi:hypothetical protein
VVGGAFTALFYNATSDYIPANSWYRIKITKTAAGLMSLYAKGGVFGNVYVLLETTSTGNNPIIDNINNTSKYFLAESLVVGSKFANINIYDGIIR